MRLPLSTLLSLATGSALLAQGGDLIYTTSTVEQTLTGSGGTVLQTIHPNDIVGLPVFPCPRLAEKWLPRNAFMTMAGDEDGDNAYWEPGLLGRIDALLTTQTFTGMPNNGRKVWYSPSVSMGTTVSGAPGLRAGDIGRIVRTGAGDGKVEYFIRQEAINNALGLPLTTTINVDAAAFGPNQGLFLSLADDIACNPCGGPVLLRDGDVFCLPPSAYALTAMLTIGATAANSAVVVYTEAQMDAFVANAQVTNRFGACVPAAIDTTALEIDFSIAASLVLPGCTGTPVFVPTLLFTTESLTGGAILTTAGGGQIYTAGCGPMGTNCGSGPTLGQQIGLRPPMATLGIPSFVNALAWSRVFTYTAESQVAQIPMGTPARIDFNTPGLNTWVFLTFAPTGPGAVAPSTAFTWGMLGHPDYYLTPNFMGVIPGGFATYVSPPIPFVCDLVFQGVTISSAGLIEASTPTMIEVF